MPPGASTNGTPVPSLTTPGLESPASRRTTSPAVARPPPDGHAPGTPSNGSNGPGGGRRSVDNRSAGAAPDPTLAQRFVALQMFRRSAVEDRRRLEQSCRGFVKHAVGYHTGLPKDERDRRRAAADAVLKAITKGHRYGKPPVAPKGLEAETAACALFVLRSLESRAPWEQTIKDLEAQMEDAVRSLPSLAGWVDSVTGLGVIGVACIIGEAEGNPGGFRNPSCLWKRFRLHVYDGKSMSGWQREGGRSGVRKLTKEEWERHGGSQCRQAVAFVVGDSLLRRPNPYTTVYQERRLYEAERDPTLVTGRDAKTGKLKLTKHGDMRARRYAIKKLLKHLWQICRGTKPHDAWVKAEARAE